MIVQTFLYALAAVASPYDAPLSGLEHRPQYHLIAQKPYAGWISDPNGPIFVNGRCVQLIVGLTQIH